MPHRNTGSNLKHVVVVGAGAIGSHLLEHVARMPEVARLTIVDRDTYKPENVSSQRVTLREAGKNKVDVWAGRLRRIRPGLQVSAIAADLCDVPLGMLGSDLLLSCVDSRLARQFINQRAHRLSIPWIDAGIHAGSMLIRMNAYMPSAESPCLECPWSDQDYAALEVEYSCQKQNREMPTGAPAALGSLAASLQALEAQKMFRFPNSVVWSRQVLIDARTHRLYAGRYVRNRACRFDHRVWPHITELACTAGELTIGQAFLMDNDDAGGPAALSLSMENGPFVRKLVCIGCGRTAPLEPLPRLRAALAGAACSACGGELKAPGSELLSRIDWQSLSKEQLRHSLRELGLRPGDTYSVSGGQTERHFQIPFGDRKRYSNERPNIRGFSPKAARGGHGAGQ